MAAYLCAECKLPFCGGKVDCAAGLQLDEKTKMVCQTCNWKHIENPNKCYKHGVEYAIFKCDCCCQPAVHDCSGNHYCKRCHNKFDKQRERPHCRGGENDQCPLGVMHPPNQPRDHNVKRNGWVVGCAKCMGIDEHCDMRVSSLSRKRWANEGVFAPHTQEPKPSKLLNWARNSSAKRRN